MNHGESSHAGAAAPSYTPAEHTGGMTTMPSGETHSASSPVKESSGHHMLSPNDPDNPMAWPLWKKVYASTAAFACAFTVAYGATTYTAGINEVVMRFNVSMVYAVLGFSIFFIGVATAPIHTPHLAELFGRKYFYLASVFLFSLCILGVGFQQSFRGVLALRFLAGVFGGPCLVLIEGTFADVWSARTTVSYYAMLTLASYLGAAFGPVIGGFVTTSKGWQWLQWVTLMFAAVTLVFTAGMPETYSRQILRTRARRQARQPNLPVALSGVTPAQMATHTIINPLKMFFTEPIVMMSTLYLGLNFAVIFQWFITVPAVLNMVYNFNVERAGLAFIAAIGGALLGAFMSITLEHAMGVRMFPKQSPGDVAPIERRMFPAMAGSLLVFASLFWIGFTASPTVSFYSPIFGTAFYVWGNFMVLVSFISYLFDAYPPQGTLSALTTAAVFRLICAGTVPVGILPMFMNLSGAWALATFGFISLAMIPFPFLIFFFGARLRERSPYSKGGMSVMEAEMQARHEMDSVSA